MTAGRTDNPEVVQRIRGGILWTALGAAVTNLVRVAVIAVLGRLLVPSEFGVVAASLSILMLLGTLRDLGVGLALVQHRAPSAAHVETALAVSIGIAVVLSVAMSAGAEQIAHLYGRPEIAPTVRVLAALLLLRAIGQISQQLCQRAMDFRRNQAIELASYLTGAVVSIGSAIAGAGAWALVLGYLAQETVSTVLYLAAFPPGWPSFDRAAFRDLLGFGGAQTVAGIANIIATQADYIVVGRVLGTTALGFYTRAYELVQYPAKLFSSVVGSVLFPAFSRLQDDRAALSQAYERTLFCNAVALVPAAILLIVAAPETLEVLLGPGWDGAVVPFQIILISMLFRTSYKTSALVLQARGAVGVLARAQLAYAACVVVGSIIAVRWGIAGVAATTSLSIAVQFVWLAAASTTHTDVALRRFVRCHLAALPVAVASAAAAIPAIIALRAAGVGAGIILAAAVVIGLVAFTAVAALQVHRRHPLWTWAWQQVSSVRARRWA